jgi:arginyl-tRNA synthetase
MLATPEGKQLVAPKLFTYHCDAFLHELSKAILEACKQCGAVDTALPASVSVAPHPNPKAGDLCDLSFSTNELLKAFPEKPAGEVSELLAAELPQGPVISAIAAGRYVNLVVDQEAWTAAAVKDVLGMPFTAPSGQTSPIPRDVQHWLIEFSSPNTNKPQHLGHVRNNLLGDSCSRLLSMLGHKVTKVNLVNDRGIHICKSMMAYQEHGACEVPTKKGDHFVGDYYVKFEMDFQKEWKSWLGSDSAKEHFEVWKTSKKGLDTVQKIAKGQAKADKESNPEAKEKLMKEIPDLFESFATSFKDYYFGNISPIGLECNKMLEAWETAAESVEPLSDETYKLWKQMNQWVVDGFWQTYTRMGIQFDHVDYESLTYQLGKSICETALQNGVMHKNATGAVAIGFDKLPALKRKPDDEKVLLRAKGTSVYMTQDLGTAFMRWDKFNAERMVYVVAEEQREHFQVLFELLALLHPEMKDHFKHLSYGMVNLPEGRMKSREGTVVDADDLMDEMSNLAASKTRAKWPSLSEEDTKDRAEKIGLAALKFFILSARPESTMVYDPSKSIKFEGKTGPHALYQYVRTRSILRKAGTTGDAVVKTAGSSMQCLGCLCQPEERAIVRCLATFNSAMISAAKDLDTAKVCNAVYALLQTFNIFFNSKDEHDTHIFPIVDCPDPVLKQARLLLVEAVGVAIRNGLALLGIETIEHM